MRKIDLKSHLFLIVKQNGKLPTLQPNYHWKKL